MKSLKKTKLRFCDNDVLINSRIGLFGRVWQWPYHFWIGLVLSFNLLNDLTPSVRFLYPPTLELVNFLHVDGQSLGIVCVAPVLLRSFCNHFF